MQKNSSSYPVEFVADPFGDSPVLAELLAGGRVLLVADMNVVQHVNGLGTKIGTYFQNHGLELAGAAVVIPGGEKAKMDGLKSVQRVIDAALDARIGHRDAVLALGGGSVLDVAGYVASQVRGGIRLVRMPTTPAAMIDAAFSHSASLDCGVLKDALRLTCVPSAVVIGFDLAFSVQDGVWNAGGAEMLRFAAVSDAALLKKILKLLPDYKARKREAFEEVVRAVHASRMKKGATEFALWSAARLEALSDYRLPHGYAVAIGILIDSAYAVAKGVMKPADRELIVQALKDSGALDGLVHSQHLLGQTDALLRGLDAYELVTGTDQIVLPTGLGKSTMESVDREVMRQSIRAQIPNATAG